MKVLPITGKTQCASCEIFLPEDLSGVERQPCPNCGSTKRNQLELVQDSVVARESVLLRALPPGVASKNKFKWEMADGCKVSRDGSGRLVYEFYIRDREADYYTKVVQDALTLEIIKAQSHRLSEHQGYGSAKFKKPE